jgi:predicted TIM-barrel fold metal-dependent hydrolase
MPDDGDPVDALHAWLPEAPLRRILVDNPKALYGFS